MENNTTGQMVTVVLNKEDHKVADIIVAVVNGTEETARKLMIYNETIMAQEDGMELKEAEIAAIVDNRYYFEMVKTEQ